MPTSNTPAVIEDDSDFATVDVELFGETFPVVKAQNLALLLLALDPDEPHRFVRYVIDAVPRTERTRLMSAIASHRNLTGDELQDAFSSVLEAQGDGVPTNGSSGSSSSSTKKRG